MCPLVEWAHPSPLHQWKFAVHVFKKLYVCGLYMISANCALGPRIIWSQNFLSRSLPMQILIEHPGGMTLKIKEGVGEDTSIPKQNAQNPRNDNVTRRGICNTYSLRDMYATYIRRDIFKSNKQLTDWLAHLSFNNTSLRFAPGSALLLCLQPPSSVCPDSRARVTLKMIPWGRFCIPLGHFG